MGNYTVNVILLLVGVYAYFFLIIFVPADRANESDDQVSARERRYVQRIYKNTIV